MAEWLGLCTLNGNKKHRNMFACNLDIVYSFSDVGRGKKYPHPHGLWKSSSSLLWDFIWWYPHVVMNLCKCIIRRTSRYHTTMEMGGWNLISLCTLWVRCNCLCLLWSLFLCLRIPSSVRCVEREWRYVGWRQQHHQWALEWWQWHLYPFTPPLWGQPQVCERGLQFPSGWWWLWDRLGSFCLWGTRSEEKKGGESRNQTGREEYGILYFCPLDLLERLND